MNHESQILNRLFRAARHAAPEDSFPIPFGFEARVLAALRGPELADDSPWLPALFRRAMLVACGVTLACWLAALAWIPESVANELTLADSIMKLSLLP